MFSSLIRLPPSIRCSSASIRFSPSCTRPPSSIRCVSSSIRCSFADSTGSFDTMLFLVDIVHFRDTTGLASNFRDICVLPTLAYPTASFALVHATTEEDSATCSGYPTSTKCSIYNPDRATDQPTRVVPLGLSASWQIW